MLTESQLRQLLPLLPVAKVQEFLPHLNEAMRLYEINTLLRTAAFVAQTGHESAQFTRMVEGLNYTKASGLMATWPKRFPTEASALPYVRNAEKLANFVYAGRMGNGDSASGDGFRYRGRGVIQLTGRDGYRRAGQALGLDLEGSPDLAMAPDVAFKVAGLYWMSNGLNPLADVPDLKKITQRINGGQVGQADREKHFKHACEVLAAGFVADLPLTRGARSASTVGAQPARTRPFSRGWQDRPESEEWALESAVAEGTPQAGARKAGGQKAAVKKAVVKKAIAKKAVAKNASPRKPVAAKKPATAKTLPGKAIAKPMAPEKRPSKKPASKTVPAGRSVATKSSTARTRAAPVASKVGAQTKAKK